MMFEEMFAHLEDVEWKLANAKDLHSKVLFNQNGALRDVIEMHKPTWLPFNKDAICAVCINYDDVIQKGTFPMPFETYPCPTIQVIHKALNNV